MDVHKQISDVKVFCLTAQSFPEGIMNAFNDLDKLVGQRNRRTFYGISYGGSDGKIIYKAAATEIEEGEGEKYNMEYFTIKKGNYLTGRITEWKQKIGSIAPMFQRLMEDPRFDDTFPCVEWYKNENELVCMVKMK
jgi:predicted transcriptional regulator YdeE